MIPETATKKLAALVQQAEDARALAHSAKARAETLGAKVVQLGHAFADEAAVAKTMADHEQALDLQMQRYRHWQDAESLCTRLQSWLRELPSGTRLEVAPTPLITMNGAPSVAIADIRAQIAKLATEFHQITVAGPTRDDARLQIRELVQSLAAKGRPRIDVQRGEVRVSGWIDGLNAPTPHSVTVQFLAWLAPQLVIDALERELEAVPLDAHALPHDQRKQRLAEIEAEIALLEAREEAVIERAAKDNISIPRRDGASPAAILGVRVASAAARAAA